MADNTVQILVTLTVAEGVTPQGVIDRLTWQVGHRFPAHKPTFVVNPTTAPAKAPRKARTPKVGADAPYQGVGKVTV